MLPTTSPDTCWWSMEVSPLGNEELVRTRTAHEYSANPRTILTLCRTTISRQDRRRLRATPFYLCSIRRTDQASCRCPARGGGQSRRSGGVSELELPPASRSVLRCARGWCGLVAAQHPALGR